MSSTSNAQNLLVNVFRPTYTYQAGVGYTPSLVVSNVDKVVADTVVASNLVINDPGSNVYVGCNAGNPASNVRASSNNVAVGYNAGNGFSNTSNTVALGYNALGGSLSNVSNTVALGANTIGGGVNNILIGHDTGTIGSNNILIGPNQTPGNISNQLRVGLGSKTAIAADLSTAYVGINSLAPIAPLDVSGQAYFRNKVGIQIDAPTKSLEVNGQTYSTLGFLAGRGTVGNPAYAFYADGSTGLYSPNNGYETLVANGLPYVTIGGSIINFHNRTIVNADISGGGGVGGSITLTNGFYRDLSSDDSVLTDISEGNVYAVGNVIANNLIYSGRISNTNSNTCNVIGGVVLSNGDVSANTYNGPGGTANAPHYTFSADRTTGLFFPGPNMIGWTAGGVERVRISNANIGIGTTAPANALDVSGTMRVIGTAGNITFSNGTINAAVGINISGSSIVASNGAFSNASTTSNSIGGVTLSNNNISGSGTVQFVNLGTNQIGGVSIVANAISNSGGSLTTGNITYSGAISNSTASNSNVIGGMVLSNNILIADPGVTPQTRVTTSGFLSAAGTLSISNIDFSGTIVGSVLNTSNRIGGVTLSNGNILYANSLTNLTNASNSIGGVVLSNNTISNSSSTTSSNFFGTNTASNLIGGVTLSNFDVCMSGTGRILGQTNVSNVIGGVTLSNTNVSLAGTITGSTANTSNVIGGVTLSNTNLTLAGTITGSTANTSNVIGGVVLSNNNVSNSGTHTSSNFIGTNTASNLIGGVTLSNFDLSMGGAGRILGQNTVSNMIAGITLSNFDLSMSGAGRILGQSNVSNVIGGVTLSNTNLTLAGTITGSTVNTSNVIGGVVLSNNNVSNSGTHTSSNFIGTSAASNQIGGVTLSNTNLTLAGTITGSTANTSNAIGGVVLSNSNATASRVLLGAGTALAPSLTFSSSTNLGIYSVDSDEFAFVSANAERCRVNPFGLYNDGTSSNTIGGVVLTGSNITAGSGSNSIGSITLNGGRIQATGVATPNAPAYTFLTDATIGMYLAGANTLGFATAGTQQMVISNSNVGIGTTSTPSNYIHIQKGNYSSPANNTDGTSFGINLGSSNYTDQVKILAVDRTNAAGVWNGELALYTSTNLGASTEKFRINGIGNVGIGTSNPSNKLTVAGNIQLGTSAGDYRQFIVGGGNSTGYIYGAFAKYGDGIHLGYNFYNDNSSNVIPRTDGAGTSRISLGYGTIGLYTGGTNTEPTNLGYYQDNAGNVGIKTNAPGYTLDVCSGTVRVGELRVLSLPTGYGAVKLQGGSLENSMFIQDVCTTTLVPANSAMGGWFLGSKTNLYGAVPETLKLWRFSNNASAAAPAVAITLTGNVGLGTSNPAYQLQLSSDSAAKPTSGNWTIASDERIKQNIENADVSLCYSIVKRLRLKRFTWDVSYMPSVPDRNTVGWIAQDVSFVFPNAVSRISNEWFSDFHSLDVDQIYKTMYGALEKVIADKEALEGRVNTLTTDKEALEGRVNTLTTDKEALEVRVMTLEDQLSNVLMRLSNANL